MELGCLPIRVSRFAAHRLEGRETGMTKRLHDAVLARIPAPQREPTQSHLGPAQNNSYALI